MISAKVRANTYILSEVQKQNSAVLENVGRNMILCSGKNKPNDGTPAQLEPLSHLVILNNARQHQLLHAKRHGHKLVRFSPNKPRDLGLGNRKRSSSSSKTNESDRISPVSVYRE